VKKGSSACWRVKPAKENTARVVKNDSWLGHIDQKKATLNLKGTYLHRKSDRPHIKEWAGGGRFQKGRKATSGGGKNSNQDFL